MDSPMSGITHASHSRITNRNVLGRQLREVRIWRPFLPCEIVLLITRDDDGNRFLRKTVEQTAYEKSLGRRNDSITLWLWSWWCNYEKNTKLSILVIHKTMWSQFFELMQQIVLRLHALLGVSALVMACRLINVCRLRIPQTRRTTRVYLKSH